MPAWDTTRWLANMWAGTGTAIQYKVQISPLSPDYGGFIKTPDGRVYALQMWVKTAKNGGTKVLMKIRNIADDYKWLDKMSKRKFIERIRYDGSIIISDKTAHELAEECWESKCGGRVETFEEEIRNDRRVCSVPLVEGADGKAGEGAVGDAGGGGGDGDRGERVADGVERSKDRGSRKKQAVVDRQDSRCDG